MIDLVNVQPNVISRDLREKIVFIYGEPKSGKTTTATKFPKPLLLGFEKGYNAIAGIKAIPLNKWSEFKQALKQLKTDDVKNLFETIIVDTADIAYDLCEKYICSREGVQTIGDVPYGAGYKLVEKEFDECMREIPLLGYGLVIISHSVDKTFKDENEQEYNQIVPTLDKRARKIVERMSDIIGYSHPVQTENGVVTMLYMRGTPRFVAGSRFKYTPPYIQLTYDNLVNSIADAIEQQEKEDGAVIVDKKEESVYKEQTYDFDDLMEKIQGVIEKLTENEKLQEKNAPLITEIVDNHLGKGKKVRQATKDQTDMLVLILDDLSELLYL